MDLFSDFFVPAQTFGYPFGRGYTRPRSYRIADLSDLFEDDNEFFAQPVKTRALGTPQVHIKEHRNGWVASVHLPGVRSFEDISLDLDDEVLHIRAVFCTRYQRQVYTHSLDLPEDANLGEIRATFKNETLHINIPRLKPQKEKLQIKNTKKQTDEQPAPEKEAPVAEKPKEAPAKQLTQRPTLSLFSIPKVSQSQTETDQVTSIEFPEGWDVKDNLDVEVCNGVLNISMVKKENGASLCFKRSVNLPSGVTQDNVTAKFENNTLQVSYPKPIPPKVFKIPLISSVPTLLSTENTTTTTPLESSANSSTETNVTINNTQSSSEEGTKEKEGAVETA